MITDRDIVLAIQTLVQDADVRNPSIASAVEIVEQAIEQAMRPVESVEFIIIRSETEILGPVRCIART